MEEERRGRRDVAEDSAFHPWDCKIVLSELGIRARDEGMEEFERNKPLPLWMGAWLLSIWAGTEGK